MGSDDAAAVIHVAADTHIHTRTAHTHTHTHRTHTHAHARTPRTHAPKYLVHLAVSPGSPPPPPPPRIVLRCRPPARSRRNRVCNTCSIFSYSRRGRFTQRNREPPPPLDSIRSPVCEHVRSQIKYTHTRSCRRKSKLTISYYYCYK